MANVPYYRRSRAIKRRLNQHNQHEHDILREVEVEIQNVNNNVNEVIIQPQDINEVNENQVHDPLNYLFVGNEARFPSDDPSSDNDDSSTEEDSIQEEVEQQHRNNDDEEVQKTTLEELKQWVSKHDPTDECIEDMAAILRRQGHPEIPKSAATIRGRPRAVMNSDEFVHIGLTAGIKLRLRSGLIDPNERTLKLQFNVDGIPLWKSSKEKFWPILCFLSNGKDKRFFIVSCYAGTTDPGDLESFLRPLVNELKELERDGFNFNDVHYNTIRTTWVCDAPARSFLKAIVGHNGKSSCERCTIKGFGHLGRTVFPYNPYVGKRTSISFRNRSQREHHRGLTPLLELSDNTCNIITDFVIDHMHNAWLGIAKRQMTIYEKGFQGHDRPHVWDVEKRELFDEEIFRLKPHLSIEFNRKGRSLDDLCRWKANEFRTLFMYSGLVIFKKVLSEEKFRHFLKFHVGMRLLLGKSPKPDHVTNARLCLVRFSYDFGEIYGLHHMISNMHWIQHAADDTEKHGSLNNVSAFRGESFLGKIKRSIRGKRKVLKQLFNKINQLHNYETREWQDEQKGVTVLDTLKQDSIADSCVLLGEGIIVHVTEIPTNSNYVKCIPYIVSLDEAGEFQEYYDSPLMATEMGTYVCDGLEEKTKKILKQHLNNGVKCESLPFTNQEGEEKILIVPLLHHERFVLEEEDDDDDEY